MGRNCSPQKIETTILPQILWTLNISVNIKREIHTYFKYQYTKAIPKFPNLGIAWEAQFHRCVFPEEWIYPEHLFKNKWSTSKAMYGEYIDSKYDDGKFEFSTTLE